MTLSLPLPSLFLKLPNDVTDDNKNAANYCCGASVGSEQQHNQDLRRIHYIKGGTNARIHHFLPASIAFNQIILRHFLPEYIAPRTTRGSRAVVHFRVDSSEKR